MLQRMTALEYAELRSIAKHEPIGSDREDIRSAIVAYSMSAGDAKLKDFMPPRIAEPEKEQTIEDMLAELGPLIPCGKNGDVSKTQHSDQC